MYWVVRFCKPVKTVRHLLCCCERAKRANSEIKAVRPQVLLGCAVCLRCDGAYLYLNFVFMLRPHVAFMWSASRRSLCCCFWISLALRWVVWHEYNSIFLKTFTAAFKVCCCCLTKKNISYLEHLCTQPPPINTTAPELIALPIHLWLLLVI